MSLQRRLPVSVEERIGRLFLRLGALAVLSAALLGFTSLGSLSARWAGLGVAIHLLPAVLQLIVSLRTAGRWLAVFLIIQAVVSTAVLATDVHTLQPNMTRTFVLEPGAVIGLEGPRTITTDRLGFRTTRDISYEVKDGGTLRIFVLGGSTAEQLLLDDHRTWTHLLQKKLQAAWPEVEVEVINAGASGTRALNHLATLRSVAEYRPDFVLLLVGINDWNKHIKEHYGSRDYGAVSSLLWSLRLENTLLGRVLRVAAEELSGMNSTTEIGVADIRMLGQTNSLERSDRRALAIRRVASDYADVLEKFAEECARLRTRCVFLTQPHAYWPAASAELRRNFWMTPPFEDYTLDEPSLRQVAETYNRHLLELAGRQGTGSCDIAQAMRSRLDGFYDDCHFNDAGASAVATSIAECLLEPELPPHAAIP